MYENETQQEILQRLLTACNSTLNKNEGGFVFDSLSPSAIELALAYIELDNVINLGFVSTTSGNYLDYKAEEYGLTRLAATKATGQITITGTNATVIPAGSLFSTAGGIQFETLAEVTISGTTVVASVRAVVAGISGNVAISAINTIPIAIPGVTSVDNAAGTTGGTDQETDEALRDRILEKVQNPATSGNSNHYVQWAKEVAGVGDARCLPLWDGNGTVKVVIIDGNKEPASGTIVTNVETYIETVRPIGADVTVVSASAVEIDVDATLTLLPGYILADVKTAFETNLTNYLKSIAFEQSYVSYAVIGSTLLDTEGVQDYADLTVNLGTSNISIANTEVATKGTVTLSE
jgi:uncharacterized phage protein gp47/JayE